MVACDNVIFSELELAGNVSDDELRTSLMVSESIPRSESHSLVVLTVVLTVFE